jgi:hypothetical protein
VTDHRAGTGPIRTVDLVLRVLVAAGLAYSAYVHFHLAHLYDGLGTSITQGQLFRVEATVAVVVAVALLVTGHRFAWWAAALVGASSVGALLLYHYIDVGSIGPIPNMHDPTWYPSPDKALSGVAEAGVVLLVLVHEVLARRRAGVTGRAARAPQPVGS